MTRFQPMRFQPMRFAQGAHQHPTENPVTFWPVLFLASFSFSPSFVAVVDRPIRSDGAFVCYGSRYFGGSVPHTGRGNRGTSRQPDSAHGQRILALRMCQGASFAGSRLLLDTFYAPVKSDHERHPAPMPDRGTMSLEFRRT